MSNLPTTTVTLDDGSGTFTIDISAYVEAQETVSVSNYGRSDEFSEAQGAQLTLTLDNSTGVFTSTGTGFGVGAFGVGPFGGSIDITPDTPIRVSETFGATTRDRFTGRIRTSDLGWPGGGDTDSTIVITATDVLTDLRGREMLSLLDEQILLYVPDAYYTLGEASGSMAAGDSSGNAAAPLSVTGSGAALAFGASDGSLSGTGVTFAGGKYLLGPSIATTGLFGVVFRMTTTTTSPATILQVGSCLVSISGGNVLVTSGASSFNLGSGILDGKPHDIALIADGTYFIGYVDGAAATFDTYHAGITTNPLNVGNPGFSGTISHLAVFVGSAPSDMQVLAIHQAAAAGATESTADHLARLASYFGTTPTVVNGSGELVQFTDTSGSTLLDAMQATATAEGGVLFVDGSGALVLQGRNYRGVKTTADLTVDAANVDGGVSVAWDTQQKVNRVAVTRSGGAAQIVQDAVLQTNRNTPVYPQTLDVIVASDNSALNLAQWELAKHKATSPRIASATFTLHDSPIAENLLQLEVGDRISLSNMPPQLWSGATDYTVEGWTENLTDQTWTLTLNLLPWSLFQCAVYDDPASTYDNCVYAP